MTAVLANPEPDTYAAPCCRVCGGPTWRWRGSVHGYTCTPCLDAYLADSAARGAERDRRERERLERKQFRQESRINVTAGYR